jgi:hypothetical protein
MLPSGYPGVVRDGVGALRWAGAAMEKALQRIPEWVAEDAPANERALAEAKEKAKRERMIVAVSIPDAAGYKQTFTNAHAEVMELASRLERRTHAEWQSGDAAQYFSGLELRILENWAAGEYERLIAWLGEKPGDIRRRQMEFGQLSKWLRGYMESNA